MKTAREMGLVACRECNRVWPMGTPTCGRCGQHLRSRDPLALQKVWAWWLVGLICYFPANVYPMLRTEVFVTTYNQTIVGGALELWHEGSYAVSGVILLASVFIPTAKFIAIAALAFSVTGRSHLSQHHRQMLYEVVEFIGRWSMVDVFVVAILSSLVHLGAILSINPGRAALFFALTVITTMISAKCFDSRLIWDDNPTEALQPPPQLPRLPHPHLPHRHSTAASQQEILHKDAST